MTENSQVASRIEDQIDIFSTCPQSKEIRQEDCLNRVAEIAGWSERQGCRGILIYADNSLVDPWVIAQHIIANTVRLSPLVAVQPVYMHPYSVAKMTASLGHLYGRRLYLNMIAGGFKNDLEALGDQTPHDLRYDRLVEYTAIIRALLAGEAPVTFEGQFYKVHNLRLQPALASDLIPEVLVSGSSEAGLAAARAMGATAVHYPRPASEYTQLPSGATGSAGVRVGIIARETSIGAWAVARARFPEDRRGQLRHQMAMKVSDSVWHKQLSDLSAEVVVDDSPYWLVPFENYRTFCPYLVGSYAEVSSELARYIAAGYTTYILDIPPDEEELYHANCAFQRAIAEAALCRNGLSCSSIG